MPTNGCHMCVAFVRWEFMVVDEHLVSAQAHPSCSSETASKDRCISRRDLSFCANVGCKMLMKNVRSHRSTLCQLTGLETEVNPDPRSIKARP
jgi:hypothetical protein